MLDEFVVISPYSSNLKAMGLEKNPKDYPWWKEIVSFLKSKNLKVFQIGTQIEKKISDEIDEFYMDMPFEFILELLNKCKFWMSVDNFLQHLAEFTQPHKAGIVLWGKSDPKIFGYEHNFNLYLSRKKFRKNQFLYWYLDKWEEDVFVKPEIVCDFIKEIFNL